MQSVLSLWDGQVETKCGHTIIVYDARVLLVDLYF